MYIQLVILHFFVCFVSLRFPSKSLDEYVSSFLALKQKITVSE